MVNTNRELFEQMPIHSAVTKLMIPTILGALVMVLYNLADTLFVGMLNNEIQSAAVSLAAPAMLAFNAVNNLFGVGSSSMMSRALGAGDQKTVTQSASFGLYGSLISAALLSVLFGVFLDPLTVLLGALPNTMDATRGYMLWAVVLGAAPSILNVVLAYLVRAEGSALHASIGTMSGCALNILLDPLFILEWGLDMGAAGAGLATFISNCVACAYFLVLLTVRRNKTNIRLSPRYFRPTKRIVKGICAVGIPASIQNLLNVTGMTVLNNFVKGYGASALAAIGIANKIQLIPLHIALGGTQGVMPFVSYSYSAGNSERFRGSILFVARLMLPAMAVISVGCFIFSDALIGIFIDNAEVIAYGAMFLRGLVTALPFMLLDFLAVGVFQSVGMGRKSLAFAILRKIILEIPAIVALNALFGAGGITFSGTIAELVLAVCGVILVKRITDSVEVRS